VHENYRQSYRIVYSFNNQLDKTQSGYNIDSVSRECEYKHSHLKISSAAA